MWKCSTSRGTKGNSLVVQWLELRAFAAEGPVPSLVRELRSHKPHGQKTNKQKKGKKKIERCKNKSIQETVKKEKNLCQLCCHTSNCKSYSHRDFPGGAVVENRPANAGDTGSSSGLIPHAAEQLRYDLVRHDSVRHDYWACSLEPESHNYWARVPQLLRPSLLELELHNKRSHDSEKPAHRKEQ